MISLTKVVYNDTKLIITSINLTCNIEIKISISCNNTPLWLRCKSNSSWLANKKRAESLSWKIDIDRELHWVVSCKTDTWEYRLSRIWIDIHYGIRVNLEFLIELYLLRQIPENTAWVVSGLIVDFEFLIELHLHWYCFKRFSMSRAFTTNQWKIC